MGRPLIRTVALGLSFFVLVAVLLGFLVSPLGSIIFVETQASFSQSVDAGGLTLNSANWPMKTRSNRTDEVNLGAGLVQGRDFVEVIVGTEGTFERLEVLVSESQGRIVSSVSMEGKPQIVTISVPRVALSSLRWQLMDEKIASYIEPNVRLKLAAVPNDPDWLMNWGLAKIKADYAWNTTTGGQSVAVAVVDTGVDWNHPDLANNVWNNTDERMDGIDNDGNGFVDDVRGWDFVDTTAPIWQGEDGTVRDNDPMDFHGHGTHCAGIVAAVGNNGIGVSGVTWNCKVMPVRGGYLGADGGGYLEVDDAAAALVYAANNGASIISCSWGSYYDSPTIREAIRYAYDAGCVLVAAAGNDFTSEKNYPAAYDEVVAISASGKTDGIATFSNFGEWIDVAAPGVDIYSTIFGDSYDYMSGTSMATPFVAGVAALIKSQFPNMNKDQVREQLRFTSDDLGEKGIDPYFGYGRVNARKAVELVQEAKDLVVSEMRIDSIIALGKLASIDVTLLNTGTSNQHNLVVQLLANGTQVRSENVPFLASGELKHVNLLWDTSQYNEGHYNLTAYAVPITGESRIKNNALSKTVLARAPRTIRVPYDFTTIQEAIDAAFEGDTVKLAAGSYWYENAFIYRNSLRLIGSGSANTIIYGDQKTDVIRVEANSVEIYGVSVRGSRRGDTREPPFSGVLACYSNNINITDVTATSSRAGIFLYCSCNAILRNNHMAGNNLNFGMDGMEISNFIHNIDESNIVDGQPLKYIVNQNSKALTGPVGCAIVVNSTKIDLNNLNVAANYAGIFCIDSTDISVTNCAASRNGIGLYIRNCAAIAVSSANMSRNDVGILVEDSSDIIIENSSIIGYMTLQCGIKLQHSTNCCVKFNNLNENKVNLCLSYADENVLTNNNISKAWLNGISLIQAHENLFAENQIYDNIANALGDGLALNATTSFNNLIYHNNFANNTCDILSFNSANVFDDGYPSGGNYWKNYSGTDFHCGEYQNLTGSDGIGDTIYMLDASNADKYPFKELNGWQDHPVSIRSNTTITDKRTSNTATRFIANGAAELVGFVNVTIPVGLNKTEINVFIDTQPIPQPFPTVTTNNTHYFIYFDISAGPHNITIRYAITDIAVINSYLNKQVVAAGSNAYLYATLQNQGDFKEVFNAAVHANSMAIASLTLTLASKNSIIVVFIFNTTGLAEYHDYEMTVCIQPVLGETDLSDNTMSDGLMTVVHAGDINSDGKVDIEDVARVSAAFGTYPGHPKWNSLCDVTNDDKVDIQDLARTCANYGWHH